MAAARKTRAATRKSSVTKKPATAKKRGAAKKRTTARKQVNETKRRVKKSAAGMTSARKRKPAETESRKRVLPSDMSWRELIETAIQKDPTGEK